MNCKKIEENIDEYVDATIDAILDKEIFESKEAFDTHIRTCESCRTLYEETIEIKMLLRDLEPVELPDDFEETLHMKLLESKVVPFYKKSIVKKLGLVSSIAAVGVIAFMSGLQINGDVDNDSAINESSYGTVLYAAGNSDADMAAKSFTVETNENMDAEESAPIMDDAEVDDLRGDEAPLTAVVPTLTSSIIIQFNESLLVEGLDIYHYQVRGKVNFNDLIMFVDQYEVSNFDASNKKVISFNIEYKYHEELINQLSEMIEIFQEVNVDINEGETSSYVKIVIEFKED